MPTMKNNLLFLGLLVSLCCSFGLKAQSIPGDAVVHGPMFSPVYNNKVRVWVLTKNNTGSNAQLSIKLFGAGAPGTALTGTVFNSDDRLGYSLRSYEYTGLTQGETYTANILVNGTQSASTATIKNENAIIDNFQFLSGGCGRIYDLTRCMDIPESATHVNGDPAMFNVMAQEQSDLMVWLGDAVYLLGLEHAMGQCLDGKDDWANKDMAFDRYLFYRNYHAKLIKSMPQLAITDNHDTGPNEFNKTMPTLGLMKDIFKDWWPNPEYKSTPEGAGLFSSYVYKDVEYFLLDNRSYRDGTTAHLGPDQFTWLKAALKNSTATFKVLINGTPSFERNCGGRNFCNTIQSAELIQYVKDNKINGLLSFSADIHEQKFMIREGDTNYPLYDVLSGNLNSDIGAGVSNINYTSDYVLTGSRQAYLRVNVYGDVDDRRMKVEYVAPDGKAFFETIIHEDMLTSQNADALKLSLDLNNAIADASEYHHSLTATGVTYAADRNGVANSAMQLTATSAVKMAAAKALTFNDKPFSLSFLVNPDAIAAGGSTILSNATATTGVSFGIDGAGKLMFTNHVNNTTYTSQYSLLPHAWSHVTWKYDNVRKKLSLYYNGYLLQTWNNVATSAASVADLTIGNNFQNKKFTGLLDKVMLYGRIISDEEITKDADVKSTRGGVLKVSGAQKMVVPKAVADNALSESFSIEFWGKLNADPGTNFKILASNARVGANSTGISFEFPDSNKLNVVIGVNGSGWNTLAEKGDVWNIGEWNHVALTATKNGAMKYYLNGVLVGEGTFAGYIPNTDGLGIGYSPGYGSAVQADLDELRIWKKVLTPEEIKQRMHYSLTGNEENLAVYYTFNEADGATAITGLGSAKANINLDGGVIAGATSPVAAIEAAYQNVVTGKWSKNNTLNNTGLTITDAITNYTSNIVIGKNNATATAAVPGNAKMTYLTGGWKIDPVNNPFATLKINLREALTNFDAISATAGTYYLLKKDTETSFTQVAEGNYDGQSVTFANTNLAEGIYYIGWSAGQFTAGRGGALSLTGGHEVKIASADLNPVVAGSFTTEFWVNLTQDPGTNEKLIANHGKINGNSTGFAIEIPDNNTLSAVFGTNTGNWNSVNSGTPLIIGEWNHVAITAVPGDAIKLYVNGELKGTSPYTAYVPNTSWDFSFGKSLNYTGQTYCKMDEFRIWSKAKTQDEIKAQMHATVATTDNLVYNLTFDQENNGAIVNGGSKAGTIAYTNAAIIDATSPVTKVNEAFPSQLSGNWSISNEATNGFYLKDKVSSFVQNVVTSRNTTNTILPLANVAQTSYVAGGWNLNTQGIATANVEIDLAKVFANPAQTNALVKEYKLLKGDPAGVYTVVATGTATTLKANFTNVPLSLGNYYLAFSTDANAVIAGQGGALQLSGNHNVQVPKEGVNAALSGPFTIEMWARLTQPAGANTKLVGFTSLTGGNFGWEMEFLGNQTLQTITGKGAAGGWNSLSSSVVWKLNEWNHTAVTFTPNGEFKFYINGELVNSTAVTNFTPNANNLAFGRNIANNAPTSSNIDEFRIWTKAKTIEEIRKDMYLSISEPTEALAYNYTFNQDNSGFLLNSGSTNVEVGYLDAAIIPATDPVRNLAAAYRSNVGANWSLKNDSRNGMYLTDAIASLENNVVVGREAGIETAVIAGLSTEGATRYLNSRFKFESLYVTSGKPKVDLSKIFTNFNDVKVLGKKYFLITGNPTGEYKVIATGTKVGSIISFTEITFDAEPVYLAWLSDTDYPVGTFPIAKQSIWKFNDKGIDLGTDWKSNTYDDSTWSFGNGIFGYGDSRENTLLSYGPNAAAKYPTYYLRNIFNVEDVSKIGSLIFKTMRDDGVVVYVNGVEAFRSNMPTGAITYNTYASTTVNDDAEIAYEEKVIANLLQNGQNVIAVELHQSTASSSDLGFDMEVGFTIPALPVANLPLPKDSKWHYLDNGSSQVPATWAVTTFDSKWASAPAPLGYGDPVATTISYGPDAANKFITSYFYRDVNVSLADATDMIEFGVKRDDGAVVYINGVEAFRDNMPAGAITSTTNAATTVDNADENRYFVHYVPKTAFNEGANRIAVEIHNANGSSSDAKFDMYVKNTVDLSVECNEEHIACFTSINPTGQTTNLLIPTEHRFQTLFKEGEAYTDGSGLVPGNNDFTAYIPIDKSSKLGHLSVNQENNPGGVSMLDIHLDEANLLWIKDQSRRVDMYNNDLVTTNRNCSGGITPWNTVISGEEATDAGDVNGDGYQDVGWLVEIDPKTAKVMEHGNGKQEKLWAMGRMNHENVVVRGDGAAAYYGEDGGTHCVYKFIPNTPGNLFSGKVYVLKLDLELSADEPSSSTATWVEVPNTTQSDRNNLNTVASSLGGTNFNGVEDCDISPLDGKIYFTSKGKNRIYRFKDNGTTISDFEVFIGGMSYPIETANGTVTEPWADGNDNLVFDDKGNLWVCEDGGNNYIWVVRPDHKQDKPNVKLFASMPAGAEPTGLTFTPDYKYGFFSVQHPNGNNVPQKDATRADITFNASTSVVFSLRKDLGLQAPVANFEADDVTVPTGKQVTFTDLSTNNPTAWQWTFEGGTPATSTEKSPVVTFAAEGKYDVKLITSNEAGSSEAALKEEYIVVLDVKVPVANFEADDLSVAPGQEVTFTDLSTNTPTAWEWTFEGGTPATSTEKAPVVTFATEGKYDVKLITSNEAGSSEAALKEEYIVVEVPLSTNDPVLGKNVNVYPNPTKGKVTIELNNNAAGNDISVEVFDILGRKVSDLSGLTSTGGKQKIELDLSGFIGEQVFIIQLHVGTSTATYKMLKVN